MLWLGSLSVRPGVLGSGGIRTYLFCRTSCLSREKVRYCLRFLFVLELKCYIRFNETEGIAAIASLISRYQIEIKDEPQFKHETFEERKTRILSTKVTLTLA